MTKKLSNFSLTEGFNINTVAKTIWLNNAFKDNLVMQEIDDPFKGYDENISEYIDASWNHLKDRAKSNFPPNTPFVFYNSNTLSWRGLSENNKVLVSKGITYKDIASIRSNSILFKKLKNKTKPNAFVVVSLLITSDNKIVLGRRKYYGDWLYNTFETAGAFLKIEDLADKSLVNNAKNKVCEDFNNISELKTIPFIIYHLPRILETVLVCISKTNQQALSLTSDLYSEILIRENSKKGLEYLIKIPLNEFHPPSRVVIQAYYQNFTLAKQLLEKLG